MALGFMLEVFGGVYVREMRLLSDLFSFYFLPFTWEYIVRRKEDKEYTTNSTHIYFLVFQILD